MDQEPDRDDRKLARLLAKLIADYGPRIFDRPKASVLNCPWNEWVVIVTPRVPVLRSLPIPVMDPYRTNRSNYEANEPIPPPSLPRYVTLSQVAPLVNRHKKTLEKLKTRERNPLPAPDVEGGGGKPDEWEWAALKVWLEAEFNRKIGDPLFSIPDGRKR